MVKFVKYNDNIYNFEYIVNVEKKDWNFGSELRFYGSDYCAWFSVQGTAEEIRKKFDDICSFLSNPSRSIIEL